MDRQTCQQLDSADPLRAFREEFDLPEGIIYLDGNSLGPLPRITVQRLDAVLHKEWGQGLIRSWTDAHWMESPHRVGEKIARLIGAAPGEVVVADSTSVNLFKLLAAALSTQPGQHFIVTEEGNFPTDLYIAGGVSRLLGGNHEVRAVPREDLGRALDAGVAVLMLTHVDYTTAYIHDMTALTDAAHRAGALALWDLSHSAGAVPLDLQAAEVDLAVGCGYKYLNGGPGAPAYLFVARRLQERLENPIAGWMGHAAPFDFAAEYRPAFGVGRMLAGTPSILGITALEAGVDLMLRADQAEIRRKSIALCELFVRLLDGLDPGLGLGIASPRDPAVRGSHVAVRHPQAQQIIDALAAEGVIADFRPPDIMRFGLAPLYTCYVDIFDAVQVIQRVVAGRTWERPAESGRREASG